MFWLRIRNNHFHLRTFIWRPASCFVYVNSKDWQDLSELVLPVQNSYVLAQIIIFIFLCSDINVEHTKKQLHISLGYQHQPELHDKLDKLAREIDLSAECRWEIRLYSRDSRLGKHEVSTSNV